jgi:hypothetical protein
VLLNELGSAVYLLCTGNNTNRVHGSLLHLCTDTQGFQKLDVPNDGAVAHAMQMLARDGNVLSYALQACHAPSPSLRQEAAAAAAKPQEAAAEVVLAP